MAVSSSCCSSSSSKITMVSAVLLLAVVEKYYKRTIVAVYHTVDLYTCSKHAQCKLRIITILNNMAVIHNKQRDIILQRSPELDQKNLALFCSRFYTLSIFDLF